MKTNNPQYKNKPMKSAQGEFPRTEEYIRFTNVNGTEVCFMNNRYLWPHDHSTKHQQYKHYMYVDIIDEQWYARYPADGYKWEEHVVQHLPIPYFDHEREETVFQFSTVYDLQVDIITELQKMYDWKSQQITKRK